MKLSLEAIFIYSSTVFNFPCFFQVRDRIVGGNLLDIPENAPPYIVDIMKACWKYIPEERIFMKEILLTLKNMRPANAGVDSGNSSDGNYEEGQTEYTIIRYSTPNGSSYLSPTNGTTPVYLDLANASSIMVEPTVDITSGANE